MFKPSPPAIIRNDYVIEPGPTRDGPPAATDWLSAGLFASIVVLQFLDLHSTLLAMGQGRAEMNPFILRLASAVGLPFAVCFFKIIALAFTGLYFVISKPYRSKKVLRVPLFLVAFAYAAVVLNNYSN